MSSYSMGRISDVVSGPGTALRSSRTTLGITGLWNSGPAACCNLAMKYPNRPGRTL